MANRYWVGGTANWDGTAGTKWATTSGGLGGAAIPTTADDVFFDGSSGAAVVTVSAGNTGCKSINCTAFTGTLTGTAALTVAGSFTLVAGMTFSCTGRWTITATATLTSAGKSLPPLLINGTGITVDQNDAFTFASPATNVPALALQAGTYRTNNFNITISNPSSGGGIAVTGASTRTMRLGSSNITISFNANLNVPFFDATIVTNLTFQANTSSITCTTSNTGGNFPEGDFIGGGLTFYNVTFTNTATNTRDVTFPVRDPGPAIPQAWILISGTNTFNNLTFTGRTTGGIAPFLFSANQTINGTLTCSAGSDMSMRNWLLSDVQGTSRTLTCAVVSLTDVDFQDITIAGAAAPASGTRMGNCGNNSGITFAGAKNVYWNLAGTNNWNANAWATSSGAGVSFNNFPLPQDTAIFDNTQGSSITVNINDTWNHGSIDLSARTNAIVIGNPGAGRNVIIHGNWKNGSGTSITGDHYYAFRGVANTTLTSAGKSFPVGSFVITAKASSNSFSLADAFSSTSGTDARAVYIVSGVFDANNYSVTSPGATISGTRIRTLAAGNATWTLSGATTVWSAATTTNLTVTGTATISLTSATAKTFTGGNFNYGNLVINQGGAGALTINGNNKFRDITSTFTAAGSGNSNLIFQSANTTTVDYFTARGSSTSSILGIRSSGAARGILLKSYNTVRVNYLNVSNSNATGGAIWYAGRNSSNTTNNVGWIFGEDVYGDFLPFFLP